MKICVTYYIGEEMFVEYFDDYYQMSNFFVELRQGRNNFNISSIFTNYGKGNGITVYSIPKTMLEDILLPEEGEDFE